MWMAGKGLWWCWIVAYVAVLGECHHSSVTGVVRVDDISIKVTSVGFPEGTDENLRQHIASYMENAVKELGQGMMKREEERDKVQKPHNGAVHLVTENMGEQGKKPKMLWRKSMKKGDEHILVLVDSNAANQLIEVKQKAGLIVEAFTKFDTGFETDALVREMVGVYPEKGEEDGDGVAVAVGVYVTRSEISVGTRDVEEDWIKFEKVLKGQTGWVSMGQELNVMFKCVRKVDDASESVRGLMNYVRSTGFDYRCGVLAWTHENMVATYTPEDNADLVIIGPLQHYLLYIIDTMAYAVVARVECSTDAKLLAIFHNFGMALHL